MKWDSFLSSDVGTGLLLGGGLSWLSPSHGYAADTIKELDVILVTGELVTATATNAYSDLFRALKGGGNRFGIVTRYEVEAVHTGTHEDKAYFGGLMIVSPSLEFPVFDWVFDHVIQVQLVCRGPLTCNRRICTECQGSKSWLVTLSLPSIVGGC
jgi:hypothetical protein